MMQKAPHTGPPDVRAPHGAPYTGMPAGTWFPPTPQVLKNVWMLIVGYKADPDAIRAVLPPGLEPHDSGLVQMNMYELPDPADTSGFGAFSLTYLTVEVAGHDSLAAEGTMTLPGRYYVHYWNSSERVRTYVREGAGIPAEPGVCSWSRDADKLVSTLSVEGQEVIKATAAVTDEHLMTIGGHLHYYTHRQFPDLEGGTAIVSELVELPIPFIADVYDATVEDVSFDFSDGAAAAALAPSQPLQAESVLYGKVALSYPAGRRIIDYQAQERLV